jgi:hypothetical protein
LLLRLPTFAICVIHLPLVGIRQHIICFCHLFETFFCVLSIVPVPVRVPLQRLLLVGFFDVIGTGIFTNICIVAGKPQSANPTAVL